VKAHRELARMPVDPLEVTPTTAIPVVGPTDGSMVVDGVITAPVPVVRAKMRGKVGRRRTPARR